MGKDTDEKEEQMGIREGRREGNKGRGEKGMEEVGS